MLMIMGLDNTYSRRTLRYSNDLNLRNRNYFDLYDIYSFRKANTRASRNRLFKKITDRYNALILGEIRKIKVPGYEFDDLRQEVLIVAYQVVNRDYRVKSGSPFWFFLRLCIRRRLYSLLTASRTLKNQAFVTAQRFEEVSYFSTPFGQEYFNLQISASGSSPEDLVIEKIMLILVVKELKETLTDVEYTMYFERSLNNLSYKQIMDKYGYNYKKIDNALARVVKKLARLKAVAS